MSGAGGGDRLVGGASGRSVLGGMAWTLGTNLLTPLLLLGTSVAAARFLGPVGMGRQSYIAFASISMGVLLSSGLSSALHRYVGAVIAAGRGPALRGALRRLWALQFAAAAVAFAVLAVVAARQADASLRLSWLLAAGVSALSVLQTVPNALLVGAQRWRQSATIGLVTGTAAMIATVGVLAAGLGIPGMFTVELFAVAGNLGWSALRAWRVLRELAPAAGPPAGLTAEILRFAAGASVQAVLAYAVWQRTEFLLLDRYSRPEQIAAFSIAYALVAAVQRVFTGALGVLHPALSALYGAGQHDRIQASTGRALRLVALAVPPVIAGMMAVGPRAITVVYGSGYAAAGPVLLVLVWVLPLVVAARISANLLHVYRRLGLLVRWLAVATVVDVAASFLLIPAHAAIGAAWANTAAQGVAAILEIVLGLRIVGGVDWQPRRVALGLVAAGCAGAAGFAAVDLVGGAPGIPAGALAVLAGYLLAIRLCRPFSAADLDWLQTATGARLAGPIASFARLAARADAPASVPDRVRVPGG